MFDVEYYKLPNGNRPVKIFINSLDTKMRLKALGSIDILAEFGNMPREPYLKALGMDYLNYVLNSQAIQPEYFIFSLWAIKLSLQMALLKRHEQLHVAKLPSL